MNAPQTAEQQFTLPERLRMVDCMDRWESIVERCNLAANEIERLEYIQRDFHNVGDVAEIRRLRIALVNYVRARLEGRGELAHHWWTLQEIAKEDPRV